MNISLFQDLCDLCGKDERMPGRVEPRGIQREVNVPCLASGIDAQVQWNCQFVWSPYTAGRLGWPREYLLDQHRRQAQWHRCWPSNRPLWTASLLICKSEILHSRGLVQDQFYNNIAVTMYSVRWDLPR